MTTAKIVDCPDHANHRVAVEVRGIKLEFQLADKRLKVVTRVNTFGGKSTSLSDGEYRDAVRLAGAVLKGHKQAA